MDRSSIALRLTASNGLNIGDKLCSLDLERFQLAPRTTYAYTFPLRSGSASCLSASRTVRKGCPI